MTAAPPAEQRIRANGIELCYFEWNPEARGHDATLLLAHATGFHARCWDQVVRHLGTQHIVALDQRSHGRSQRVDIVHWNVFGQDLAAFVRALDLRRVVGVGHSMGGHALIDAAAECPEHFDRLVLLDPVVVSPEDYAAGTIALPDGEMHPTAKRKRHFSSPDAMFDRFKDRPPYTVFEAAALRDYCTYGLLPVADGYELACPPEIEASIYMTSRSNGGVLSSAEVLSLPVLIVRAKDPPPGRSLMDFSASPTWPGLAGRIRRSRAIQLHDRSHFLPMEIPQRTAELILE